MSLEFKSDYRLDESLFERMVIPKDPACHAVATEHLTVQRRMHPRIADITRLTYPYLQDAESTYDHPSTAGLEERVFWLDHRVPELEDTGVSKSHVNRHEAEMIQGLVGYLLKTNSYSPGDIAVLTPYSGQLAALHNYLGGACKLWLSEKDRELLLDEDLLDLDELTPRKKDEVAMSELLRVTTVDNFQGEEAKVIILSTVRSGGRPGFLAIENRVNVACSRARDGFYIVGNSETLRQVPMWRDILDVFKHRIGFGLITRCDRHPDSRYAVYQPDDFSLIRDCHIICGYELPCGHNCDQKCHPMELHKDKIMPCLQQCQKVLKCGHRCLRACSVGCGACIVSTGEKLLYCGHQGLILCSGEVLKCMHLLGQRTLDCGHVIDVQCGDALDAVAECKQPCSAILECGHMCTGICGRCSKEGHGTCSQDCEKILQCGHYCKTECGHELDCPPCEQLREVMCEHGVRRHPCHVPPEPCLKLRELTGGDGKTIQVLCCLPTISDLDLSPSIWSPSVRQHQDLDKFVQLPDTIKKVNVKINHTLKGFATRVNDIEIGLDASFDSFKAAVRGGVFAWDANHGLVVHRVTDAKELRTQIATFNDGVVKQFEDHLTNMSTTVSAIPNYCFLASLRLEAIEYRAISVRLVDHLRIAKHLLAMTDPSYQVQRMGEEICRITQAEALVCLTRDLPKFLKDERLRLLSSPSLDVEFRLREVFFWLIAYDALQTMESTSNALEYNEIARFLESLDTAIDISRRFPSTHSSLLGTTIEYKAALQAIVSGIPPSRILAVDVSSLRKMERNLGASSYRTCEMITCEKQHPYDATVFGSGCPECGKRVEMSDEVYVEMSKHLQEGEFLNAMLKVSVPKTDADVETCEVLEDAGNPKKPETALEKVKNTIDELGEENPQSSEPGDTPDNLQTAIENFGDDEDGGPALSNEDGHLITTTNGESKGLLQVAKDSKRVISNEEHFLAAMRKIGIKEDAETGNVQPEPTIVEQHLTPSNSSKDPEAVVELQGDSTSPAAVEVEMTDEEKFLAAMKKIQPKAVVGEVPEDKIEVELSNEEASHEATETVDITSPKESLQEDEDEDRDTTQADVQEWVLVEEAQSQSHLQEQAQSRSRSREPTPPEIVKQEAPPTISPPPKCVLTNEEKFLAAMKKNVGA